MNEFWSAAIRAQEIHAACVVVTLVSARGHAPQEPGAKAIITDKGLFWGTVGGGKLEARAIEHSRKMLAEIRSRESNPELLQWNLQRDIGMTCGGEVTILFEVHQAKRWQIVIFGAGHVAQALVRVLESLSCQILCIDPRAEWLDKLPASPKVAKLLAPEPAALVGSREELSQFSYFVVLTQGHSTDLPVLTALFKSYPTAPYIGVMGSTLKARKVRAELKELGVPEEQIALLRCPIGLELGTNDPAEIAISIAAELLQARDQSNDASGSTPSSRK